MNWLIAFIICAIAAVLESVGGGSEVKSRLASLRMPRFSPPLWLWIAIGGLYYITCFVLLGRIIGARPIAMVPLVLVLLIMMLNTLWTLRFFRKRDLNGSSLIAALYVPLAVALAVVLWNHDRAAAFAFAPYLCYLAYGTWWTYAVWRDNRSDTS
jgi:translocator protein